MIYFLIALCITVVFSGICLTALVLLEKITFKLGYEEPDKLTCSPPYFGENDEHKTRH